MRPREIHRDEVEIRIFVEDEEIPVEESFATDEPDLDRKLEQEIRERLARGDVWAWCSVTVEVRWKEFSGEDHLGCCSYESEEDFRSGDYFESMVDEALGDLNQKVLRTWERISELLPAA